MAIHGNDDVRKPISPKQAPSMAGVSPDTVARWCKRYGIGKQLHWKAPWRVGPAGLVIVAAVDSANLRLYQERRQQNRS